MKLCLGTVQFGMDYGIKGQRKPALNDCISMLDYATQNGIDAIDTANAYGEAEDVLGTFFSKKTISRDKLFLTAKVKPNILDEVRPDKYYKKIKENFELSCKRMGVDYIDGYMFHSSRYIFNAEMLEALKRLKKEGFIRKYGVSVYYPDEAKEGLLSAKLDIMQFPYSVFDQRMEREGVFKIAKTEHCNTEIHTRSAFIQGLITMDSEDAPDYLTDAKPILREVNSLCSEYDISPVHLAIQYVKKTEAISRLVFGVDNMEQLKQDISYFYNDLSANVIDNISVKFNEIPAEIMMPSLWVKK